MNRNRLWLFALGGGIAATLVAGWFLGVSPILGQVSDANAQRAVIADANTATQVKITTIKSQFAQIDTLRAQLGKLAGSVPATADSAVFLRELGSLTTASGVKLQSVTLGVPTAFTPPVAASSTGTAGATPAPTPVPSPAASAAASAPKAAGPLGRLVLIPAQVSISGNYANVMAFVRGVQTGERLYLANSMTLSKDSPTQFTVALAGAIFALPSSAQAAALVEQQAPISITATPTPTPTP